MVVVVTYELLVVKGVEVGGGGGLGAHGPVSIVQPFL